MTAAEPSPKEILRIWRRVKNDAPAFCRHILGVNLWRKQHEILRSVFENRKTTVKSANGTGKSFIGAQAMIAYGTLRPGSLILTTATTFRQVEGVLWREARKAVAASKSPLGIEVLQTQMRWLKTGSYAMGLTAPAHDSEKMRGYRADNMLLIADEASGLSPDIFDALMSMMSGQGARLLLLSNPSNPQSQYAATFATEGYKKFSISAFDTPNFTHFGITEADIIADTWREKIGDQPLPAPHLTSPGWVRERYLEWCPSGDTSDSRYRCYVHSEFPSSSPDNLIPFWMIEQAQRRPIDGHVPTDPIELGVDISRFGADFTVIMLRVGWIAKVFAKIHGHDTMAVAGAVARAADVTGATAIKLDEIGVGGGVVDRLRELRRDGRIKAQVCPINVAKRARDHEKFDDARAEAFWGLKLRFEKGEIVLDGETSELASQLASLRWKPTSDGKIRVESKEDAKRRGIKSPDEADALALAYCNAQDRMLVIR